MLSIDPSNSNASPVVGRGFIGGKSYFGPDPANPPTIYKPGAGTNDGFVGRTGIYELITVNDRMRSMIHDGVSEQQLEKFARKHGGSIRADGRRRVLDGTTTLEEVVRVTRED